MSEKKIIDYTIVCTESTDMDNIVRHRISIGWQPLGGVSIACDEGNQKLYKYQTLVKYESEAKQEHKGDPGLTEFIEYKQDLIKNWIYDLVKESMRHALLNQIETYADAIAQRAVEKYRLGIK